MRSRITTIGLFFTFFYFLQLTNVKAQYTPGAGNILYVDSSAAGTGTGTNWTNAVTSLADALHYARDSAANWAIDSLRIYVAKGTYLPKYRATDSSLVINDRDDAFVMVKNVQLFGGFPTGGGSFFTRDYKLHPTVLSGDIGTASDTDNCYHVVVAAGNVGNALMDGFIITKGNADVNTGALINNLTLQRNAGGAMRLNSASPRLSNLIIVNNKGDFGGGLNPNSCASIIKNVQIIYNTSTIYGGGMYINNSFALKLINVEIANNTSPNGGGICNNYSSPTLTNLTIANNHSSNGGGIKNYTGSSPVINNTIFYGNTAASSPNINNADTSCHPVFKYSYMGQSGTWNSSWGINGGNNIISLENPFVDTANGNFQLNDTSLAIGTGNNPLYIGNLLTDRDLARDFRLINTTIDIGAYEYMDITPSAQNIVYVDSAVIGGNHSGNSWANAVQDLAVAIHSGRVNAVNFAGPNDSIQVYVAKGTYFPKYRADDSSLVINDRDDAFVMVKNLQLYGGFNPAIGDSTMATRDWETNHTILSGDIGIPNNSSDNCYHIVISSDSVGNALLDGFTISNGKANGNINITVNSQNITPSHGAGIYDENSSPKINNVIVANNNSSSTGGGIYNNYSSAIITYTTIRNNSNTNNGGGIYNDNSPITLSNAIITNNYAYDDGAGIYNNNSSLSIISVIVKNNNAHDDCGGIYNYNSSPTIRNTVVVNNTANDQAGGIYNQNSTPTLINLTIANNSAGSTGGGIVNYSSSSSLIYNTIIYGNTANSSPNILNTGNMTFAYSYVEGASWQTSWGTDSIGNITDTIDPFIDTANGNFQLKPCAYPVNAGSNALYNLEGNVNNDSDLAGNARLFGDSIDMGAYEVQIVGIPPTVNLGNDTSICANTSLMLDAGNTGSSFLWSNNTSNQTLSVSLTGTYYVTVTDSDYCIGSDTIHITIDTLPTVSISSNSPICSGTTLNLNASGGNTYAWSGPNGFSSTIQNPTIASVTTSAAGIYIVTVTNVNGCSDTAQTTITVNQSPVVSLGSDTSFCSNTTINLTLDAGNAGASYLWSDNSTNQTLIASSAGTYSVIVTNTFGCTGGDTIVISTTPFPVASFEAETESDGITVEFENNSSNANSYIWDFGDGDSTNNTNSEFDYTYPKDSDYTVTLIAINGCGSDTMTQGISVKSEFTGKDIPTGITPNGDGVNDKWIIEGLTGGDNSVSIFNRWGILVWKINNYDNIKNVWNGTNQDGNDLPDATYFYLIKVDSKAYKGWVNISR